MEEFMRLWQANMEMELMLVPVSILALNDGPFFTMLALGAAGYSVPVNTLAGCVVPILAGVILGNLDPEIRKFCEPGATMLIPFFALPLEQI